MCLRAEFEKMCFRAAFGLKKMCKTPLGFMKKCVIQLAIIILFRINTHADYLFGDKETEELNYGFSKNTL